METKIRKLEHVEICLKENVECKEKHWFNYIHLIHKSLPEVDFDDITLEVEFLGKKLKAPIIVVGMTGGHEDTLEINSTIAEVVEELGLGMGVGSQRAAIENSNLEYTFKVVREKAPTAPIIGNIGVTQLVSGYTIREVVKAIEMIDADAIAVHLNPAQEVFQIEGDKRFTNAIRKIIELAEELEKPVIVKETGCGISMEVASKLASSKILGFDISGAGGTSWIIVEMIRVAKRGFKILEEVAKTFTNWGNPTVVSIIETRYAARDKLIIASGGLRSGLDIAKSIALGADLGGIGLPVLKYAVKGKEELRNYLEKLILELKIAMFLTGSKNIDDLRKTPIVLDVPIRNWIEMRGIDIRDYLYKYRVRGQH